MWAFIAPLLVIVAINLYVFIRIMVAAMSSRRQDRGAEEQSTMKNLRKGVLGSASFLCLLGITWIFGAVAIGQAALIFFYIFALCNTLQGAVIFLFQVLLDPKFENFRFELILL